MLIDRNTYNLQAIKAYIYVFRLQNFSVVDIDDIEVLNIELHGAVLKVQYHLFEKDNRGYIRQAREMGTAERYINFYSKDVITLNDYMEFYPQDIMLENPDAVQLISKMGDILGNFSDELRLYLKLN